MQKELAQAMAQLQVRPQFQAVFESCSVMVVREDGLVLWANRQHAQQSSGGVLMGGAWKAALALAELHSDYRALPEGGFRLGFDTPEEGFYVVPVSGGEAELLVGMLFFQEQNPGWLKHQFRGFAQELGEVLAVGAGARALRSAGRSKTVLFDEISDDEIEQLFSSTGF